MTEGIVFDIKEFAVHDGPGIRLTVFLKGCPLSCLWCHNPESQSAAPQRMQSQAGERMVGRKYSAAELAAIINAQASILRANNGGLTFSGGEPLLQAEFVLDVIKRLNGLHVLLDTCGYASEAVFRSVASACNLIHYDLKLMDPNAHRAFTGCDNQPILRNLGILGELAVPFIVRIPLVPGITDTAGNLQSIACRLHGLAGLRGVELLPYNRAAGAKYAACGRVFDPPFDPDQPVNADTTAFAQQGISAVVA